MNSSNLNQTDIGTMILGSISGLLMQAHTQSLPVIIVVAMATGAASWFTKFALDYTHKKIKEKCLRKED